MFLFFCGFYLLLMFILFLADSRKFYPLIFADGFHFSRIFFISRGFSQILFADFRGFFFMFFFCGFHFSQILADFIRGFLRVSFLADSRGFYSRIFADFISRRLSQILSADFRGWFSFLADFFYVFNLYFNEISIWIFWVIRLVDPKHGIQFFVSYVFDIVSVPNRHVYIGWF